MADKVIVRQDNEMQMAFEAVDPRAPEDTDDYHVIERLYDLTPHGMLLASLGACTCIMLHSYAQNHDINLREVDVRLRYTHEPEDRIEATVSLAGEFDEKTHDRLYQISPHCTVHHALREGIAIDWSEFKGDEGAT
jgi:uncharacterized OsmC-like protein